MTSASAPKPTSRSPDWRLYVAVAHAPSNVRDDAGGKSFTFITTVVRYAMGPLLRAAFTLV